ncbi:MAG TPA: O-antigen polymerase [Methylomusa anaerophila]|uniref:Oligosaccharide repeat unit polymerase n=1 Tax=Methylomusa anaerophila TaxID=1930071 RepID=A0A348AI22_9FIRM|nr:O-antigen polymerase [Methylomusa anaerophila]BBB90720.1 hypothetical protein MAMMFC1_01381 [Methylomusa anaerophila]HML88677.1 O-antigen polymerase [Methylomusa anaerophila]
MTYYWLITVLGFTVAIILSLFIHRLTRDLFVFTNIFSLLWGASILINIWSLNGMIRVEPETLTILFGAWWLLLIGALCILQPYDKPMFADKIDRKKTVYLFLFLIGAHLLAFSIEIASMGINLQDPVGSLAAARVNQDIDLNAIPWFMQPFRNGYTFYIPLGVIMLRKGWISGKLLAAVCVMGAITSLVFFTRGPLFKVIMTILVSLNAVFPKEQNRIILICGLLGLLGFLVFGYMQSVIDDVPAGQAGNGSQTQAFASYIGGPMLAYETILEGNYLASEYGLYSFDIPNYILKKMGFIHDYTSLIREYMEFPIVTNVYTFLDCFTLDFGIAGAMAGALGIGMLAAAAYNLMKAKGSFFAIAGYSMVSYCLLMAIANNEFIRFSFFLFIFSSWIFDRYIAADSDV